MDRTCEIDLEMEEANKAFVEQTAAIEEYDAALERRIGTARCYGTTNIVRPDFSANADRTVAFNLTKRSA